MPTTTFPPILIWQPGGGTPVGPVSNPPVYSQAGITPLLIGQNYVDVVFGSIQTTSDWVLVECDVTNTADVTPLNIWTGLVTNRTTAGFRVWLNGLPDTGNYYLHWAVSGVNIPPVLASTYYLTGPASGGFGVPSTFTVSLPPSTVLASPVVVTPGDGSVIGLAGTFSPAFVTLTTGSPTATFTYTPSTYGVRTISTTNSGPMTNPAGIVFNCVVTTYTFTGPTSGNTGSPSTNFTAALPVGGMVTGTVTVTPHDGGGGGTFTPTTVALTTASPSHTFTYTPATNGTKAISVTNDGGLTDPAGISYVASTPFLPTSIAGCQLWVRADAGTSALFMDREMVTPASADGDPVGVWADQSAAGTFVGVSAPNKPIFKTNIVNGLPVVRFVSTPTPQYHLVGGSLGTPPWTIAVVMRAVSAKQVYSLVGNVGGGNAKAGPRCFSDGDVYLHTGGTIWHDGPHGFAFHVLVADTGPHLYVDGVSKTLTDIVVPASNVVLNRVGANSDNSDFSDGDIAELLYYDSVLGTTDRQNVEAYLRGKYATP